MWCMCIVQYALLSVLCSHRITQQQCAVGLNTTVVAAAAGASTAANGTVVDCGVCKR